MELSNSDVFRISGVDRTQFNPVADAWSDLPPTTGGKPRQFKEHHVISLFAFRGFINLGYSLRNAADSAAKISDELRTHGDDLEAYAIGVLLNPAMGRTYGIPKLKSKGSEEFGRGGLVLMVRIDFDPIRKIIRGEVKFNPEYPDNM